MLEKSIKWDERELRGREREKGALATLKLANELVKDNPHMSENRMRQDRKGESEKDEIC